MIKKKIKILYICILLISLTSCGFKKINQIGNNTIYIQNINIIGEPSIAYPLKNNILLISSNNSDDKYDLKIKIQKKRTDKIKDKAGRVRRYNLSVTADLQLININNKIISKTFVKDSDYEVAKIHTKTINNQNKATENIVQQLSEEIIYFVALSVRNR